VGEIQFGIDLMTDSRKKREALAALRRMTRKPMFRITGETGDVFGWLAAQLRKTGRARDFRVQDLWLASQAVQRDFTLLTTNAKDCRDIPELKWAAIKVS